MDFKRIMIMESLNTDVLTMIIDFLSDLESILAVKQTCKSMNYLATTCGLFIRNKVPKLDTRSFRYPFI